MKYLTAKNDGQLGMCLRMLYADGFNEIEVKPVLNERKKMEFHILLDVDDARFNELKERFDTFIN